MVLNKSFTTFIKENTLQGAGIQRSQYSSPPSTCSEMKWCLLISNPVSLLIIITTPNSNHAAATAAKSLQSCPTLCDPIDGSPPRLPRPWDSPGKNTGVGCHFLLQCMKVKSESEVTQLCPTPSDPMDCSPPGPSVHGIFQARVLEWVAIAFSVAVAIK